jgi:hypothetical protein
MTENPPKREVTPETHPDLFGWIEVDPPTVPVPTFEEVLRAFQPERPPLVDEDTGDTVANPYDLDPLEREYLKLWALAWRVHQYVKHRPGLDFIPSNPELRPRRPMEPQDMRDFAIRNRYPACLEDPSSFTAEVYVRWAAAMLRTPLPKDSEISDWFPGHGAMESFHYTWLLYATERLPLEPAMATKALLNAAVGFAVAVPVRWVSSFFNITTACRAASTARA